MENLFCCRRNHEFSTEEENCSSEEMQPVRDPALNNTAEEGNNEENLVENAPREADDISQMEQNLPSNDPDNNRETDKDRVNEYRKYTGKISWLSQGTRPDLSYSALMLAKKNNSATISDLRNVNKIVGKIKKEENKVVYGRVGDRSSGCILQE